MSKRAAGGGVGDSANLLTFRHPADARDPVDALHQLVSSFKFE